jgi:hypothetical protein
MSVSDFLDLPDEAPKWKQDAAQLGIQTFFVFDMADSYWEANLEWFGEAHTECGETEREAVIALLFRLKLD